VILFLNVKHKREGTMLQGIARVDYLGNFILSIVIPFAPSGMMGRLAIAITGRYKPILIIGFILLSIGVGCLTLLPENLFLHSGSSFK
jgi:hypothetical protein